MTMPNRGRSSSSTCPREGRSRPSSGGCRNFCARWPRRLQTRCSPRISRDDTALCSPEEARRVMELDRQVMESGAASIQEEELTAAGVTRTYLTTKTPYRDRDGIVLGLLGNSRDITNRKRAEDALRASEGR